MSFVNRKPKRKIGKVHAENIQNGLIFLVTKLTVSKNDLVRLHFLGRNDNFTVKRKMAGYGNNRIKFMH